MVGDELPEYVGLCPDPTHTHEFFVPLDEPTGVCPEGDCTEQLVVYAKTLLP